MKSILVALILITAQSHAHDGVKLGNCLQKAFKETIDSYRVIQDRIKVEKLRPKRLNEINYEILEIPSGETGYLCQKLSQKNKAGILSLFTESYNGQLISFDSTDIARIKLSQISESLSEIVDCYQTKSDDPGLSEILKKRNLKLIEDTMLLMTKTPLKDFSNKTLGELDLLYCN